MSISYERSHPYVRQGLSVCPKCGTVVSSEKNHTEWHERLDKLCMVSNDE